MSFRLLKIEHGTEKKFLLELECDRDTEPAPHLCATVSALPVIIRSRVVVNLNVGTN